MFCTKNQTMITKFSEALHDFRAETKPTPSSIDSYKAKSNDCLFESKFLAFISKVHTSSILPRQSDSTQTLSSESDREKLIDTETEKNAECSEDFLYLQVFNDNHSSFVSENECDIRSNILLPSFQNADASSLSNKYYKIKESFEYVLDCLSNKRVLNEKGWTSYLKGRLKRILNKKKSCIKLIQMIPEIHRQGMSDLFINEVSISKL